MSNKKKLEHAEHNESVCDFLCGDDTRADWIVTTAFYAALHFADYKIFPYKYRDNKGDRYKIASFEVHYSHFHQAGFPSKHAVRLQLVQQNIPAVGADYKWLKDTCYNARYVDYKFPNQAATIQEAKQRLAKFKAACI